MLVIARRPGERVWLGDDISITVVESHSGAARLAIDAPKDIKILRDELRGGKKEKGGAECNQEQATPEPGPAKLKARIKRRVDPAEPATPVA